MIRIRNVCKKNSITHQRYTVRDLLNHPRVKNTLLFFERLFKRDGEDELPYANLQKEAAPQEHPKKGKNKTGKGRLENIVRKPQILVESLAEAGKPAGEMNSFLPWFFFILGLIGGKRDLEKGTDSITIRKKITNIPPWENAVLEICNQKNMAAEFLHEQRCSHRNLAKTKQRNK